MNCRFCRREKEAHATHWPPALAIPQELQDDEAAAPEQFKCPITLAIMTEPALTPNGEDLGNGLACPGCAADDCVLPAFHACKDSTAQAEVDPISAHLCICRNDV